MYPAITEALLHEMDALEDKYSSGAQVSAKDLEDIDRMAHALKCIATYEAMRSAESEPKYRERYEPRYRRY